MPNTIPTTLRLDEPVYDRESRHWHFPIINTDTGRTVGRGDASADRTVAQINAERQITKIARETEAMRLTRDARRAAHAHPDFIVVLLATWLVLIVVMVVIQRRIERVPKFRATVTLHQGGGR